MFRPRLNLLVLSARPQRIYGSASFAETQDVDAMIQLMLSRTGNLQVTAMQWTLTHSMSGTMLGTAMFID
jgi:hypothetical protein